MTWMQDIEGKLVCLETGTLIFVREQPGRTDVCLHIGRWDLTVIHTGTLHECQEFFDTLVRRLT